MPFFDVQYSEKVYKHRLIEAESEEDAAKKCVEQNPKTNGYYLGELSVPGISENDIEVFFSEELSRDEAAAYLKDAFEISQLPDAVPPAHTFRSFLEEARNS